MQQHSTMCIDNFQFGHFDSSVLNDLKESSSREWIETNGIGGFALGTLSRLRTRRYHGLLFATHSTRRLLMLNAFESAFIINGVRYETSSNQYPDIVHPTGYKYLTKFTSFPWPTWTYNLDGIELEACVWMIQGQNTTVVEYRVVGSPLLPITLQLRPILTFRDADSLTYENPSLNPEIILDKKCIQIDLPNVDFPSLFLAHNSAQVSVEGFWYRRFQYLEELSLGQDYQEDGFSPLVMNFNLSFDPALIIASTNKHEIENIELLRKQELEKRTTHQKSIKLALRNSLTNNTELDIILYNLAKSLSSFVISEKSNEPSIVAGYPWLSHRKRNTLITLPALMLIPEMHKNVSDILAQFDTKSEETADIPLWYIYAVGKYLTHIKDIKLVKDFFYPKLQNIFYSYVNNPKGIDFKIAEDGLIQINNESIPLTWMDAIAENKAVTPRTGKPVEIQALWFNALMVLSDVAEMAEDHQATQIYKNIAIQVKESFNNLFWNNQKNYLYDVITAEGKPDYSLRPNQIFALSLPYIMVSKEQACKSLEVIETNLLTPYGLRTLAQNENGYKGKYIGTTEERNLAYHQGTVWPFLLGPFISAYIRFHKKHALPKIQSWLINIKKYLNEAVIGSVSEVFDGDFPYHPRGYPSYTLSVAEIYRCLMEDISNIITS